MDMRKLFTLIMCLVALASMAQLTVTPNPVDSGYTGQIVIIFDATRGNGGMVGAKQCYAHTGLITAASKNTGDWKNVIGSWRSASQPQLESLGDNKWRLVIDNMYSFYNVPQTTDIKALAFVFHDGPGGTQEGKAASGDIFIWIGEDNSDTDLWAAVDGVTPTTKARPAGVSNGIYYDANDPHKVTLCTYAASRTESAKRVFLLGDMTDWKLDAEHQLYKDGNYFWITLNDLEPGQEYRFQYAVERADGVKKQICDLYSEKVLHPHDQYEPKKIDPTLIDYPKRGADGGYVTVIQTNKPAYDWSDATLNFQRPDKNNLVIYELWVYDYTAKRTIEGVRERLDYLKQLGVNAIELMPVSEFEGNMSWGYNPTLYFAFDKAYGTPEMFKQFVDECHQHGIAVIVDMVFNHTTGLNPMAKLYPWGDDLKYNPWFCVGSEVKHDDNDYGEDWNHDFEPAHEMFTRVFQYWLTEYKIDGFRLDLSHGLCGRTKYNAPENLIDYNSKGVQATSPGAYLILEHWGSHAGQDYGTLINNGMLCWMNTNNAYCQIAMGWMDKDDDISSANRDGYVSYCESHDEERMQYKCKKYGNGSLKNDKAMRVSRVPACVAMNVLLNGSHMLWQFEEIGYDFSINSDVDHENADKSDYRCSKKPRPEPKGYFKDADRVKAYERSAQAIQLRTRIMPDVFAGNPTASSLGHAKTVRYVQWSSDVYVVANFDASNAQTATLPEGTWYDYYDSGTKSGTITLQAGELKIFTGREVTLPTINLDLESLLPIENIETGEMPKAQKILRDGQILILRGNKTYTITGCTLQ